MNDKKAGFRFENRDHQLAVQESVDRAELIQLRNNFKEKTLELSNITKETDALHAAGGMEKEIEELGHKKQAISEQAYAISQDVLKLCAKLGVSATEDLDTI